MVFGVHKMLYTLLTIKKSIRVTALIESDLKNAFVKKAYSFSIALKPAEDDYAWFDRYKMHGLLEKLESSLEICQKMRLFSASLRSVRKTTMPA